MYVYTCPSIADDKDRVADMEKLFQLNYFQNKELFWLQSLLLEGEVEERGGLENEVSSTYHHCFLDVFF